MEKEIKINKDIIAPIRNENLIKSIEQKNKIENINNEIYINKRK